MIHVVQRGDTLGDLAVRYGVTVAELAWLNQIPDWNLLMPGQALLIPQGQPQPPYAIEIGGFAYPFISPWVLRETLPFLNLLSVFSYGFTVAGTPVPPKLNDQWLVDRAAEAGVRAALVLTPFDVEENFNNLLVNALLADRAVQLRLLEQLEQIMVEKGYGELNIDFEYVLAEDRVAFAEFVALAADRLSVPVSVCLAPKTSAQQRGLGYEGKDYRLLGEAADRVLLMTYEWGYKYGPPMAVAPIDQVRRVAEYALTEIPAEKISLGLANYGYDWPLPYVRRLTRARTIGSVEAVSIARRVGAEIQYSQTAQSPWFRYWQGGVQHEVWFEDVRSWQAKFDLIREFNLTGVGIWTVMNLFRAGLYLLGETFR